MQKLQKIYKLERILLTIFLTTALLLTAQIHQISADETITLLGDELEGPNVCKKIEEYTVEVVISETQPYQERSNTWCWQVPPSKYLPHSLFCSNS